MLTKIKIKNHFDRASNSYENVAGVQKKSANFLVEKLLAFDSDFYPQTILDLGSGTGYIPELLMEYYAQSLYTLNDIAPKMVERIKLKFIKRDNLKFYSGDMETIEFADHDLIISNLAFQWAHDLWGMLLKFHQKCNIFAFSCLLDGTFYEWQNILNRYGLIAVVKQYPTEKELVSFFSKLRGNNFYFQAKDFQLTFPSAHCFIKYLTHLGAGMSNITIPTSVLKSLIAEHDKALAVTYKVFFAILKK